MAPLSNILQAETNWRTSAEELAALKKLHDGVHGQLREALDRTILQDQETIEVLCSSSPFLTVVWLEKLPCFPNITT